MKRAVQFVVGIAISGFLLWMALKDVHFADAWSAMARVAWWVYPLYLAQLTLTYTFRTWRWQMQVERLSGRKFPFWDALGICSVSFAGTFLLPFRLGELIRPFLAAQQGYGRKSVGLATVALERVVDGLVMTACLAVILTQLGSRQVPTVITVGGYLALLVFGGALAFFVAAYRWRDLSLRFWRALLTPISTRIADKVLGMLGAFIEGLKSLPTLRDVGLYLLYTLLYWFVNGLGMWLLAAGMGLDVPLLGAFFVLACLVVGITIPAGPGNVGNFEYAIQISLAVFGVSQADGAAYGIWTHLVQMVHMMAMAAIFIGVGRIQISRIDISGGDDPPTPVSQPTPPDTDVRP